MTMPLIVPSTEAQAFDDFFNGTTGAIFMANSSGGGAGATTVNAPEAGRPGQVQVSTGSTATGRCHLSSQQSALLVGGGAIVFESLIYLPTISTAAEEYVALIGLGDNFSAATQTDGVYFEYDRTSSVNWRYITAAATVVTAATSATAVAIASWLRMRIEINAAGTSAEFFVNGVSLGTSITNIPTAAGQQTGVISGLRKTASAGSASIMRLDYMYFSQTFSSPR